MLCSTSHPANLSTFWLPVCLCSSQLGNIPGDLRDWGLRILCTAPWACSGLPALMLWLQLQQLCSPLFPEDSAHSCQALIPVCPLPAPSSWERWRFPLILEPGYSIASQLWPHLSKQALPKLPLGKSLQSFLYILVASVQGFVLFCILEKEKLIYAQ